MVSTKLSDIYNLDWVSETYLLVYGINHHSLLSNRKSLTWRCWQWSSQTSFRENFRVLTIYSPPDVNLAGESSKKRWEKDNHQSTSTLRRRKIGFSVYSDTESEEHDSLSKEILKKGSNSRSQTLKNTQTIGFQEHWWVPYSTCLYPAFYLFLIFK